jgi:endonuclease/exonuclease/phosphatase family metal-dependent hydrolase
MKNARLFLMMLLLSAFLTAQAQEKRYEVYSVGFYNLENLFDTIHDKGKNDYEFLPDGTNKWGTMKYTNKLKNMARVLNEMGTDLLPMGMAAVGVSEIENSRVLEDLVKQEPLAARGWDFVHIEGPDRRGVDCGLLYNPKLFKPVNSKLAPYTTEDNDTTYKTRGFLIVSGEMGGELVHIIVNHWPSRYAKSPARERAGVLVRQLKDSIMAAMPDTKILIMGDMNDDPDDKSMASCLGNFRNKEDVKASTDLYNPWWNILRKKGAGTLKYKGKWNLFDQIVLSGNLLGNDRSTLKLYKTEIFSRNYLFQQEGRYKGNTLRTHAGGVWLNGYSDHLPVIVYLIKEAK